MPTPRNASLLGVSRCACQLWGLTGCPPRNQGQRSLILRSMVVARLHSSLSHDVKSFNVRCGSSGLITVDIYNSYRLTSPTRPLIIYLPPTGTHQRHAHPSIPSILQTQPLAAINYRWNQFPTPANNSNSPFTTIPLSHPFPTPLHDTLHAYTWLVNHYLPSFNLSSSPNLVQNDYPTPPSSPRPPYASSKIPPRPIILYGSHLGGTLATSLALTECKASKNIPFNIAGLIAKNGIFDWTGVAASRDLQPLPPELEDDGGGRGRLTEEEANPSSVAIDEDISKPWTLQTLHALKAALFSTPASAFDSFASPTLFFRTPGVTVPKSPYFPGCEPPPPPPSPELEVDVRALSLSEAEYAAVTSAEYDCLPVEGNAGLKGGVEGGNDGKGGKDGGAVEEPKRVLSSHLKFPPRDSGLKIPRSLFLVTRLEEARGEEGEELRKQAEKMVKLMRRSVVLHELKDRVLWDEDADPGTASEERVKLEQLDGPGGGKEEEKVVAEWLEGGDY